MKNLLFLLLLTFGTIGVLGAQDFLSPEKGAQLLKNVDQFIYDLNLSERDAPEFGFIAEDFFIGLMALNATEFSRETNFKVAKLLAKDRDRRMKELLSRDQYKTYKAAIKERRGKIIEFLNQP